MALTVSISGTTDIEQGQTTALSAAVTNADGLTITSGLTYAWTASRGSFPNGATGASVTYEADFSESSDVDVDITCTVTRAANANPTVSAAALTAMADLGITGQILNMYIDETEASSNGSNTVFYAEGSSDSSLAAGSDDDVSSTIHIWRIQWHASNNWFILNANGTGDLSAFFSSNTTQSIYVVFSDGTHYEITNAEYDNGGSSWARWTISDADTRTKFDNLGADDTLLVGVGDADAVGIAADSGSGTIQVTATPAAPLAITPAGPFIITVGTTDYSQAITITGSTANTDVMLEGDWEGFYMDWDRANDTLYIKSDEVTRLVGEYVWLVTATEGTETVTEEIVYSVVPATPIITPITDTQTIYKGIPYRLPIEILNTPDTASVEGLQVGMKYVPSLDEDTPGLMVEGTLPRDAVLTETTFMAKAIAENAAARVESTIPFAISDEALIILFNDSNDDLLAIITDNTLFWTHNAETATYDPPVVFGDDVYLWDGDNLHKIKIADGELAWSYIVSDTADAYETPVFHGDGIFLFNDTEDDLIKINANTGTVAWTYNAPTGTYADTDIIGGGGGIFLVDGDDILKVSASSGTLVWTYNGTNRNFLNPVYHDDHIYILDQSQADLLKIDASDGSEEWSADIPSTFYHPIAVDDDGNTYLATTPSSGQRRLVKIGNDGAEDWDVTFGSNPIDHLYILNNNPYIITRVSSTDRLRKIDSSDGSEEWDYAVASRSLGIPVYDSGYIYLINTNGDLVKIDDSDGSVEWTYDNTTTLRNPVAIGDGVYLFVDGATDDLLKIRQSNGTVEWTYNASTGAYDDPILV